MSHFPDHLDGLRFLRKMMVLLAIGMLANTALGATAILIGVSRNNARINDIQRERASATRRGCLDVNRRHAATVRELDVQIARLRGDRRRRAELNRRGTTELIAALAPHRNCDEFVKSVVPSR